MTADWPAKPARCVAAIILVLGLHSSDSARGSESLIPFVKQCTTRTGTLDLSRVSVTSSGGELANEIDILREVLGRHSLSVGDSGATIGLEIGALKLPAISSAQAKSIGDQAYRLEVNEDGVRIRARTATGVFHGIQTLDQLIDDAKRAPLAQILDWPDLAFRGIMVDPARCNENAGYYERLLRYCGSLKINRVHLHLTDDQNVSLYHEAYLPLLHPNAWRADELESTVRLARRLHIELIPEIESLGHARVFLRHPDFREYLHQTTAAPKAGSWTGTNVSGYTNVLCPASEKTYAYLEDMYARTMQVFPGSDVHVGLDEADLSDCARCAARFPGLSHSDCFVQHLSRCKALVSKHGRRTALWGDMLLHHREMVEDIPADGTVIYDWHYRANVSDESVVFFKKHGFEVVGCPALMCYPNMILPGADRYTNIARFAEIARTHDIRGINTTIWIPTRYMSDVLWPGIAYAAGQAWAGSHWDESAFYRGFARDFFGLSESDDFGQIWNDLASLDWPLARFRMSCWFDEPTLFEARCEAAGAAGDIARAYLIELERVRGALGDLGRGVTRNRVAWDAIEQSAAVLAFTLEHFLASASVHHEGRLNDDLIRAIEADCVKAIEWIEADWNRNRFADDPDKADPSGTDQHLLHRFRQMHAYHVRLLKDSSSTQRP